MSNLVKKISSVVAGVAVVMTTVSPIAGVSAAYVGIDAANKLASLSIIVDQSANPANYRLGDTITRREQAKVTLNLAGEVVTDVCTWKYSDLPSTDWGCKYAEAGLASGYFAANPTFRPADKVSKWEALKMVMKARGIEATAWITPWQAAYVDAAVKAGVLDAAFTDYNTPAIRSDIFIWAANSLDYVAVDPFCSLLGTCPATGGTNTGTVSTGVVNTGAVLSGDLKVSLNPSTLPTGTQIPKTGIVKFAVVDLSAASSDISVNSVELVKAGLSTIPAWTKVWFEKNGIRVSGKTTFTSENNAIISFAPAFVVKAWATETVDLFVEITAGTTGNDYQFMSKVIWSSAQTVTGWFTTPVLRTADYSTATANVAVNGGGASQNASTDALEFAKFKIENTDTNADTRDLSLKSVLLYQSGSADLTNLSNIVVERNGVVVSSGVTVNGKQLSIVMKDTIKDGATALYTVKAVVNNVEQTTDTYQLYVKNVSDVNISEVATWFRAVVTGTPVLGLYSITGGDVKFVRDANTALSSTVAPGSSDVVLLKGTITAKSAVNLEDVTLSYTASGSNAWANAQMNTVYLKIGGSTFTWSPTATGAATFLGSATVNGTVDVLLYTKLKDGANGNIKFDDLKLSSFTTKEYVVNQNQVTSSIGSISSVTVTVWASTLNVARTDGLGNTTMAAGSKDKTVYSARFSSTQWNAIALSNLVANVVSNTGAYVNNVDLDLYVNGVLVNSKNVTGWAVAFNNFNANVTTTSVVDVTIKANFQDAFSAGTFQIASVTYDAVDNVTSIAVTKPVVAWAVFTIAAPQWTLAVTSSNSNVNASLLLSPSTNVKLTSFKVTASNDNIKLKDLVLTWANLSAFSNIRLVDASNNVLWVSNSNTDTGASFSNLNNSTYSALAIDQSAIYYVIADVNSTTNLTGAVVNVVAAGSTVQGSNGIIVAMLGNDVPWVAHTVAQNTFKITQVAPVSKDIATDALRFKVDAFGLNNVTLTSANFANSISGYTWSYNLDIVRASDNVVVGTASGSTTGLVTFNPNITVDAGKTETFIVRISGAIVDGGSNSQGWTVSLTELTIGSLNASAYVKNTETLPFTQSK